VTPVLHLTPLDARYPARLRSLARPPASLTLRGGSLEAARAVAIVGSRKASADAEDFARDLAATLVGAGVVVVSGGAVGIDAAAHRGALDAGGRTWAVAGTGCEHCFPPGHAGLFEAIGEGPGAMIWPFAPSSAARPGAFLIRNRVLVALSDAVVVAQAGFPSGALRAAQCARGARKPLWVVPAPPWARGFAGSRQLLDEGVHPLTSVAAFLRTLELPTVSAESPRREAGEDQPGAGTGTEAADPIQFAMLHAMSTTPLHLDEIAARAHVAIQVAAVALLTLALEAVVVEGPPGFFRRRDSYKL
jgi:DNA processing protein